MLPFFSKSDTPTAIVAIDPTDTDNLELVIGVIKVFGPKHTHVILTGRRALHPDYIKKRVGKIKSAGGNPVVDIPLEEYDEIFSQHLLEISALRFKRLLKKFGYTNFPIYHGDIAAQAMVPHALHMDDLTGFHDVKKNDITLVTKGKTYTTPITQLTKRLHDGAGVKPFVVFLGGPSTGLNILFNEDLSLVTNYKGHFAQYANLGGVSGMQWEGRDNSAQFNVKLDSRAGSEHYALLKKYNIPTFFLPTDVTRLSNIGFGMPNILENTLGLEPGLVALNALRKYWYDSAIAPREGEVLLTHDMATLFMYLQLIGTLPEIYETTSVSVTDFYTSGDKDGIILFETSEPSSHLHIATKMTNSAAYIDALTTYLHSYTFATKKIVLCGSIEANENTRSVQEFEQSLLETTVAYLKQGYEIHWGSHPSMEAIMVELCKIYPTQIHRYVLKK